MNKRLRKKKHLGEFRQLGFSVEIRLRPDLAEAELDHFVDAFIDAAIVSNGLVFSGGGSVDQGWAGLVCRNHRYHSTTESDRKNVQAWIAQRDEIQTFRLSDFWDVWHGPDPWETADADSTA